MILMEFLFAPTVPSPPSPQNLQEIVPLGAVSGAVFSSREWAGHVIDDADGEAVLRRVLREIFINCKNGGRRSILRTESISAADDFRADAALSKRRDYVKVKWLGRARRVPSCGRAPQFSSRFSEWLR